MKLFLVLTAFALFLEASSLFCPDLTFCPFFHTCCPTTMGFGCCPLLGGVCCDDVYCCPSGSSCIGAGLCRDNSIPEIPDPPEPVSCEDGRYYCLPGYRCCPNADRTDGCCLFSKAVHCEDDVHYCPPGTKCSKDGKTCVGIPSMSDIPEFAFAASMSPSINTSTLPTNIPWLTKSKSLPKAKAKRLPFKH